MEPDLRTVMGCDPGSADGSYTALFPARMGVQCVLDDKHRDDGTFEGRIIIRTFPADGGEPSDMVVWSGRGNSVGITAERSKYHPLVVGLCVCLNAGAHFEELSGLLRECFSRYRDEGAFEIMPGWELLLCQCSPLEPRYIYANPATGQALLWDEGKLAYQGPMAEILARLEQESEHAEDP